MQDLHPSPPATGKWRRLGKTSKWACGVCGFPRDANRGMSKPKEGIADGFTSSGTAATGAAGSFTGESRTFQVGGGSCPMCGTFRSGPMHKVDSRTKGKGEFKKRFKTSATYIRRF